MNPSDFIGLALLLFLSLWLLKCIGLIKEGRHRNIYSLGRYKKTISGSEERQVDPESGNLELIPDNKKNRSRLFFILYPIERASSFEFAFSSVKPVAQLSEEEKKHVEWGDLSKDNEVVVSRLETTNHHRDQYTYDLIFKDLETGIPEIPPNANLTISLPQNVKIKIRLQVTVRAENPKDAENRTGGGTLIWFKTMKGIIATGLGEIVGTGSVSDLAKLRGEALDNKKLSSANNKKFSEYINDQMLKIERLGYSVLSISFIDYEIMPESQTFINALEALAKSVVDKSKADNDAYIKDKGLEPYVNRAKELLGEYVKAVQTIRKEQDQTFVKATENLKDLRILGSLNAGNSSQAEPEIPSIQTIMNILAAQDAAGEINKPQKTKP